MKYSILWRLYLLIGFHGDYLSIELHHLSIQVICIYTSISSCLSLSFQTRSNAIVSQSLLPLKGDGRKQLFFLPSEKVHCSLSLAHIRLRMERRKFVSIKNEKKKRRNARSMHCSKKWPRNIAQLLFAAAENLLKGQYPTWKILISVRT